jgi:hypothetical protein
MVATPPHDTADDVPAIVTDLEAGACVLPAGTVAS